MTGYKTDAELVKLLKKGGTSALEELFHRYWSIVYRFIRTLVKKTDVAEDLSLEVFTKVWLFRERLDETKSMRNYLFVLSRNTAMHYIESSLAKRTRSMSEMPVEQASAEMADDLLKYNETKSNLVGIIADMPEHRQLVFRMSRYENMSNREIAERLGISPRTVEKHLQLAIRDLRKSMN